MGLLMFLFEQFWKVFGALVRRWPWLHRQFNKLAVNAAVGVARYRPHPWSTVHPYTSWTSLTNKRFSARHLPARPARPLEGIEALMPLFARPDGQGRRSERSTLLFPTFAQYLTDGFIRTRVRRTGEPPQVVMQNTSNHDIDMCPLYGRLPAQTAQLRLLSSEASQRGRLKSQWIDGEEYAPYLLDADGLVKPEFSELDPPLGIENVAPDLRALLFAFGGDRTNANAQVAAINTLFLREHNRLAGQLAAAHPAWDDDQVFETARNTVIVLFIKLVVEEYINHIAPSFDFLADPAAAWGAAWNQPNWITTEFSLLYRWHALVPDRIVWNGVARELPTLKLNNRVLLERGLRGAFADLSQQAAMRLGPRNTAAMLLPVEAASIMQDRVCGLAPYVDYLKYVGLPVPRTFADITKDKVVADTLKQVYGTPDQIEFYVGLFSEEIDSGSPLPPLIRRLVAVDAFSQALTNPLLSKHVWNEATFAKEGWAAIHGTASLKDIVMRNTPAAGGDVRISMDLPARPATDVQPDRVPGIKGVPTM